VFAKGWGMHKKGKKNAMGKILITTSGNGEAYIL
jgi:hypothetical protein